MTTFYNEKIVDHFKNPRNVGVIKNADAMGYVGDPSWGIDAELYLKIENGVITEAKSKSFGCGATIASGSVVTEMVKGKRLDEVEGITAAAVDQALGGLPPSKAHCAKLGADLITAALVDYKARQGQGQAG
jgi:nitrogen fixation protein NifU and related proteins